jgi:hypothetical protein
MPHSSKLATSRLAVTLLTACLLVVLTIGLRSYAHTGEAATSASKDGLDGASAQSDLAGPVAPTSVSSQQITPGRMSTTGSQSHLPGGEVGISVPEAHSRRAFATNGDGIVAVLSGRHVVIGKGGTPSVDVEIRNLGQVEAGYRSPSIWMALDLPALTGY